MSCFKHLKTPSHNSNVYNDFRQTSAKGDHNKTEVVGLSSLPLYTGDLHSPLEKRLQGVFKLEEPFSREPVQILRGGVPSKLPGEISEKCFVQKLPKDKNEVYCLKRDAAVPTLLVFIC